MKKAFLILVLVSAVTTGFSQIISTVAGTGSAAYTGDGGSATAATIGAASGLARDAAGNIYFADFSHHIIRKINTSGVISTFAGTGTSGFSGDGGPATAAKFNLPEFVATDAGGNVYVTDRNNHRIRKINSSGVITTYAGTGANGYSGDGGQATAARLSNPQCMTINPHGEIIFKDQFYNRLRKISTSGIITTIAGNGDTTFPGYGDGGQATAASISYVSGLTCDAAGNIYLSQGDHAANGVIRKIDVSTGIISKIAGTGAVGFGGDGGPATAATFGWALGGLAVDASNNLYVADCGNERIRKITPGGIISTIAGTGASGFGGDGGPATAATLNNAFSLLCAPSGILYLIDHYNARIRKIGPASTGNNPPAFVSGSHIATYLCQNSTGFSLNNHLKVKDLDAGQTLTWSLGTAPSHGIASISYSATSTGGIVTPAGLIYTPTPGYTGGDALSVQVSDGITTITAGITIFVNPGPATPVISGPTSVCQGSTITLTSSVTGGAWLMANGTATISSTGVVTGVSGTFANTAYYKTTSASCGSKLTPYPITINKIPGVYAVTGPAAVVVGNTITLSSATAGGVWSSCNTAKATVSAAGVVTGVSTGSVCINYTVTNACGSTTKTKTISVNAPRGMNEFEKGLAIAENRIMVYPNPSKGQFTISFPDGSTGATIHLTDITGRTIERRISEAGKEEFNLGNYPQGIYIVRIMTDGNEIVEKLLVE